MNDPAHLRRLGGWLALALFALTLASPRPDGMPPEAHRLAGVTLAMIALWFSQALPIAVTSLLPLVVYPLLGIRDVDDVSRSYLDPAVFLFMGGFFIAIGIEKWGLHRRIALTIVGALGFGPRRVVFGFMAATAFLSMWMSNTATAMLMLPIGLALLAAIEQEIGRATDSGAGGGAGLARLGRGLLLGIAYGASIGGLTTPIGTPTNIAFFRYWNSQTLFDLPAISTAEWMGVFVPLGAALLVCAGIVLTWRMPALPATTNLGRGFFRERLRELGPATRPELMMLTIFVATAALWILSKPLQALLVAWGATEGFARVAVNDTVIAIGMATLAFCLPAGTDAAGEPRRLLDWETVEARMAWGILLLIGGGFAVADAFDATGLSPWVGERFEAAFRGAGTVELVIGLCVLVTFLTEFATNVVLVNSLLPVLAAAAMSLGIDPRLLLVPATICASYGFMLPISTPPNAIVFSSRRLTMRDMLGIGLVLNLLGIVLMVVVTFTLLIPVFGLSTTGAGDGGSAPPR
jgi:sodium-dependent dicarboxylate transporter 2/3/5